jgi:hypothetical protein
MMYFNLENSPSPYKMRWKNGSPKNPSLSQFYYNELK